MTHLPAVQWKKEMMAKGKYFYFLHVKKKNQIEKQGFSGAYQNMQVILIK